MNAPASLLMVPFREVRHFQPDDCLHYEPIDVRGRLHQWTIPAHRHEGLHQFKLLERGSMVATIDGGCHRLRAPAAMMVAPGVMHGFVFEAEQRRPCGDGADAPAAQSAGAFVAAGGAISAGRSSCASRKSAPTWMSCGSYSSGWLREFQRRRPGRAEALQAHAVLLGLWFMRHDTATAAISPRQALRDTLVERYRSLLEAHFREHWPVRAYAGTLGVTADHLSRSCRAITGLGALDLLHERLLLEARRLLAYTPTTVGEIAQQLGFDDSGYFSRLFAKRSGQSPSAYRAAIAEGLAALPSPIVAPSREIDRNVPAS